MTLSVWFRFVVALFLYGVASLRTHPSFFRRTTLFLNAETDTVLMSSKRRLLDAAKRIRSELDENVEVRATNENSSDSFGSMFVAKGVVTPPATQPNSKDKKTDDSRKKSSTPQPKPVLVQRGYTAPNDQLSRLLPTQIQRTSFRSSNLPVNIGETLLTESQGKIYFDQALDLVAFLPVRWILRAYCIYAWDLHAQSEDVTQFDPTVHEQEKYLFLTAAALVAKELVESKPQRDRLFDLADATVSGGSSADRLEAQYTLCVLRLASILQGTLAHEGSLNVREARVSVLDVLDPVQVVHRLQKRLASFLERSAAFAPDASAPATASSSADDRHAAELIVQGRGLCRDALSVLGRTDTTPQERAELVASCLTQREGLLYALSTVPVAADPAHELLVELKRIVSVLRAFTYRPRTAETTVTAVGSKEVLQGSRRTGNKVPDETSTAQEPDRDGDIFHQLKSLMWQKSAKVSYNTTADLLVRDTFDDASLSRGMVISREGAGRIQSELLRDVFAVSGVKFSQGAVVFEGRHDRLADPAELAQQLQQRYLRSNLCQEVDYAIIASEPLPSAEMGVQSVLSDAALQGSTPAVVFFPRTWNTTASGALRSPWKNLFRRLMSSAALTTALLYAGDCTGAFAPDSAFLTSGAVSQYVLPLLLTNTIIQNAAALVERQYARYKGVIVDQTTLPSLSQALFAFGKRSTFLTPPRDRKDLFDIALSGVAASLTLSAGAIYAGLQLTSRASETALLALPTVPSSLLQVNTIISQLFDGKMAQMTGAAHGVLSASPPAVHLHWLAIAGISTFIATTLQLIPLNNSAGRKLTFAALGPEVSAAVSTLLGGAKAMFFLALLLNVGGDGVTDAVATPRVLLDYFIVSQLLMDDKELQIAKDNLSEIGSERMAIYTLLTGLVAISFFPYHALIANVDSWTSHAAAVFRGVSQL